MNARQQQLLDRIFEEILAIAFDKRAAFLAENCPDPTVRRELESLLPFVTASRIGGMVDAIGETAANVVDDVLIGQRVGPYHLTSRIGQGGMGAVYLAVRADEHFRQVVAIKMLRFADGDTGAIRRFRRERQILAALEHPHIARLLDGGEWVPRGSTESQPYIAMEYVEGLPITTFCKKHKLHNRDRLRLFRQVCDALSYAHQRLIIHRDIKPANILLTTDGTPKLLDFGVAKLLDSESDHNATTQTSTVRAMTPDYASPEQVRGETVSTVTDVYSLGVVLYELLTEERPHQLASHDPLEVARAICEREVRAPSMVAGRYVRGDLDVITLKALQKEPTRRYNSVEQFSEDIRRYLEGLPIIARPDSPAYRSAKFVRRHRLGLAALAGVFLALMGGIASSTWQAMRAKRAGLQALLDRDRATVAERAAKGERDRALSAEQIATAERNRAVAERQRADAEAATANAVNDFLQKDLLAQAGASAQAGPSVKADPDLKVRTALDRAAARIAGKFAGQPLVEASIRQTIASTYKDLGLFPEAQRQVERALEMRRQVSGERHPETLTAMMQLAQLYWAQGKYPQGEQLFSQTLDLQRRLLGDEHPDTLGTMNDLATVYADQGKYAPAESLYLRVLKARQRVLGHEDPETLQTMNNLGSVYEDAGKYAQAESIYAKVLQVRRRVLGGEHPDTLHSMNNLGVLHRLEGRYADAEHLFAEILEIQQRVLGDHHPDTLNSMGNLGAVFRDQGKYAEAEPLFITVVEVRRRVLGEQHPDTLVGMSNLCSLYLDQGKYSDAEPLLTNVLDVRRRVLGEQHPKTLLVMNKLATLYRIEGKYAEAEPLETKVLDLHVRLLGKEHPNTLAAMSDLATLYRVEGKFPQAEALYNSALLVRDRTLGAEHPDTLTGQCDLATLFRDEGRFAEADALLTKALEARRRVLGPKHLGTADVLASLGEIRLLEQKYAEAEALLRDALGSYENTPREVWRRNNCQSMLGAALVGQRRYNEAELMLVAGYEGLLQRRAAMPADNRSALGRAAQWLVQLYQDWGKPEKVAEWRDKTQLAKAMALEQIR